MPHQPIEHSPAPADTAAGWRRRLAVGAACLLVAACSPTFDWRELRLPGVPMAFMLPAKPAQMQREVMLDDIRLPMNMVGAKRGGLIFTAAWIDLRVVNTGAVSDGVANDPARAAMATEETVGAQSSRAADTIADKDSTPDPARIQAAMIAGMLRNIGATETREETVDVALLDTSTNQRQTIVARQVFASGEHEGKPIRMRAVFVALPTQAHQFVVIGEHIDGDTAAQFFDSIQLRALPARVAS